jgi:hypothetical protein
VWRAERALELVHSDLCGPITPSVNSYFLLLVDDQSRFMWISTLVRKDQAAAAIKDYQMRAEVESDCKLSVLRTDKRWEFTSKQFSEYCAAEGGIERHLTASYSPQQNGMVEHCNGMMSGVARSMIKQMGLPGWFWGEAVIFAVYLLNRVSCKAVGGRTPFEVCFAVYLLNRVSCKAVGGRTPFEVCYKKKPTVHHLRTFGCIVYVRNTKPHLKKLDDRSRKMIFVGYERGQRHSEPMT